MARLFSDLFTQWLVSRGQAPEVYQPGGILGGPPVGWLLTVGKSRIVYRVPRETPETLIVAMIERLETRRGLRSPFADLVRFLKLVQRSGAGVKEVQGLVDAVSWRPEDSLESVRIAAFYHRYCGGRELCKDGDEWVSGNLEAFTSPLSAQRTPRASD